MVLLHAELGIFYLNLLALFFFPKWSHHRAVLLVFLKHSFIFLLIFSSFAIVICYFIDSFKIFVFNCYLFIATVGLHCCAQNFSGRGEWEILSTCSVWASHQGGFSCFRAWAVRCEGSVVVVHGLSCHVACRIFPDQGSNQCSPHCKTDS